MRATLIRAAASFSTAVLTLVMAPGARSGDEPPRRLGDHPAIVVQRLNKATGYDYASKFYPHPAWLYLYAAPPRDAADYAASPPDAADTAQMAGAMARAPASSPERP